MASTAAKKGTTGRTAADSAGKTAKTAVPAKKPAKASARPAKQAEEPAKKAGARAARPKLAAKASAKKTAKAPSARRETADRASATRKTGAAAAPAEAKPRAPGKPATSAAQRVARANEAAARKASAQRSASKKKPARKAEATLETGGEADAPKAGGRRPRLKPEEIERFRKLLLDLRDRAVDGITFLAGENLNNSQREASGDLSNYGMHMADQGTDSFDRELALSLVSNDQDLIYEIDEALARIESGTYGICEMTGRPIEKGRLKVLPYARYCREAQEEMERGRSRFRPFSSAMNRGTVG